MVAVCRVKCRQPEGESYFTCSILSSPSPFISSWECPHCLLLTQETKTTLTFDINVFPSPPVSYPYTLYPFLNPPHKVRSFSYLSPVNLSPRTEPFRPSTHVPTSHFSLCSPSKPVLLTEGQTLQYPLNHKKKIHLFPEADITKTMFSCSLPLIMCSSLPDPSR